MGRKRKENSSAPGPVTTVAEPCTSKRTRTSRLGVNSRESTPVPLKYGPGTGGKNEPIAEISCDDSVASSPQSTLDQDNDSPISPGSSGNRKKSVHIRCERQRREAINSGYSELRDLLPSTPTVFGAKVTNASVLFRAADYITKLRHEAAEQEKSVKKLAAEAAALKVIAGQYEEMQRATGQADLDVPPRDGPSAALAVSRAAFDSLFDSFDRSVDVSSYDTLARSMLTWLEQADFRQAFAQAAATISHT